jgi:hypothetical protein
MKKIIALIIFLLCIQVAKGQSVIEPSAIGGGKGTIGWRGSDMKICIVNSLDNARSLTTTGFASNVQKGSLRGCLLNSSGDMDSTKKLIVFNGLQGTIELSGLYNLGTGGRLRNSPMLLTGGNKYIAGQTGNITLDCKDIPSVSGDQESGHCIFNKSYSSSVKRDNVAIKSMNLISGVKSAVNTSNVSVPFDYALHSQTADIINMTNIQNVYLDNLVTMWGQDENIDFSTNASETDANRRRSSNYSLTRSLIAENLKQPNGHFSACLIAYGFTLQNVKDGMDISIARNIFSGCAARTPDFKLAELEFINNFNFGFNSYPNTSIRGGATVDVVNNIFRNCPAGKCFGIRQYGVPNLSGTPRPDLGDSGDNDSASVYLSGNSVEDSNFLTNDNKKFIAYIPASSPNQVRSFTPYSPTFPTTRQINNIGNDEILNIVETKKILDDDAYFNRRMVDEFGNWVPKENPYAERVIKNWKNNYNPSISDPAGIGLVPPANEISNYVDTDNDGLSDQYEFLNTGSTTSMNNIGVGSTGYYNIEEFLHGRTYEYGKWNPAQLKNKLKAWFDVCDDKAVTLSSNKITEIRSKRGYKSTHTLLKATQSTDSLRPIRNGCWAVNDGIDKVMDLSASLTYKEAVVVYRSFGGDANSILFENTAGTTNVRLPSTTNSLATTSSVNAYYNNSDLSLPSTTINFDNIIGENAVRNPVLPNRIYPDVIGVVNPTTQTINKLFSSNAGAEGDIEVAEWLFFDTELTEAERNKVIAYLHFKYSNGENNQTGYVKAPTFLPEPEPLAPTPIPIPTATATPAFWSPSNLGSSLALWLDANDASTITLNGSTVSQWNDKSGNNRNFTQGSATNQPTYNATGLNNKPALILDIDDIMSGNVPIDDPMSVYSVAQLTDLSGTYRRIISSRQIQTGMFFGVNAGGFATFFGSGLTWNDINANSPNFSPSNPSILGVVNAGSIATPYTNGVAQNTKLGSMAGTVSMDIGVFSSQPWVGPISEIVLTSTALSTTDRQKLEGYLAHKWGLTANLPGDHPYKTTAP